MAQDFSPGRLNGFGHRWFWSPWTPGKAEDVVTRSQTPEAEGGYVNIYTHLVLWELGIQREKMLVAPLPQMSDILVHTPFGGVLDPILVAAESVGAGLCWHFPAESAEGL